MNIGQFALIKKDMRSVTSNKQVFTVLLIVPIVLTIALPSTFVFVISFVPDAASDFQKLLDMLPAPNGEYSQQQQIFTPSRPRTSARVSAFSRKNSRRCWKTEVGATAGFRSLRNSPRWKP